MDTAQHSEPVVRPWAVPSTARWSAVVFGCAVIAWASMAQWKMFERLLFPAPNRHNYEFVLESVRGVLAGTPVSKTWQHRFLAPYGVTLLGAFTKRPLGALKLFEALGLFAANIVLFALLLRKGTRPARALIGVCAFGFAHFLLMYKLEYPWDAVDILIFMVFGYWVSRGGPLLGLIPLLAIGTINHETALYIPVWYVLMPLARWEHGRQVDKPWQKAAWGLVAVFAMAVVTWFLRERYYVGPPNLPGSTVESLTPVIGNHLHVEHNMLQLRELNWKAGREYISIGFAFVCLVFAGLVVLRRHLVAALWSLIVISTIVCFGYVNETRHYLSLVAFWFAYAWPNEEPAGSRRRGYELVSP